MYNGKIKRRGFLTVLATFILICGCFFALNGTGEYKYHGVIGEDPYIPPVKIPKNVTVQIIEIDPYYGPEVDENLDDDFDLLWNASVWIWFDRIGVYVYGDENGAIHYGQSQTQCSLYQHRRAIRWGSLSELERHNRPGCTAGQRGQPQYS